ncbi:MAG: hypothetical protein ICV66_06330 [Chitinophagaceae bacterium]|nr:hypothetical protein [Chitinophagaceae bacterium]
MQLTLRSLSILSFLIFCIQSSAQTGTSFKPPIDRIRWHELIDKEQKNALRADGKTDDQFYVSVNEDINFLITQAIKSKIDQLQVKIEKDSLLNHTKKVTYLRGLEKLLRNFSSGYLKRTFNPSHFPAAVDAFDAAMAKDRKGESIERIVQKSSYDVASLLVASGAFDRNSGYKASKQILILKYSAAHPEKIFATLSANPDVPFRDSLILIAAYKYPRLLYDYASANNRLGYAIRNIDDPMVKTVAKFATSGGSGQLYFPFLDNILKGRQTLDQIDAVKDDDVRYYKLLVKTRLDYVNRLLQKDTIYELKALTDMLEKKARNVFIKEINGLHEEPDAVRFRILQPLNAQELYYLIVSSESEIYTSSYVRGVYPLMMSKIGNRGDSLMKSVSFDRFKKFIKMAAGYNTLNLFLKSFSNQDDARVLMTAFVNKLEESTGLEDGVDVADSYTSIAEGNKDLANYILDLAKLNYERNVARQNQRGMVMYNLLYKLFLSADTTKKIDLSAEFGIPPVYNVSYRSLANDSGEVVMQVFFYGDKDGQTIFQGFLRQFSGGNWKITSSEKWITISSTRGKRILIFANKPLPEETGQDEQAQKALGEYLAEKGLQPTIVIHRGHSYYAPYTIAQILPSAKIVFLGSCGGYHLLHDVLKHAPDAHIIASKQIGMTRINQPFFNLLNEKLRNGNNIDWISFWKEFGRTVNDKEGFDDYIPPHKNLGAIFIKAYNSAMGMSETED